MSSRPSAGSVASDGGSCCLSLAAFGSLIFRNNQSKEVPRKSEMAASAIAVEATPLVERPFLSLRKEALRRYLGDAVEEMPLTTTSITEGAFDDAVADVARNVRSLLDGNFANLKSFQEAKRNFGTVDLMTRSPAPDDRDQNRQVVVKRMPVTWVGSSIEEFDDLHPDACERPWVELGVLTWLNTMKFPFVCRLYGLFQHEDTMCVVSSYAVHGDLFNWVFRKSDSGVEREELIRPIIAQCFYAVRWLHNLGISHRDLSLENVVLDEVNGEQRVRLIDFGMATLSRPCSGFVGKKSYQAPEMHLNRPYDPFQADTFSLGVLLFTMAFKNYPWMATRRRRCQLFDFVQANGFDRYMRSRRLSSGSPLSLVDLMSPAFNSLLSGLLELQPDDRCNLGEVCFSTPAWSHQHSVWDSEWMKEGPLEDADTSSSFSSPSSSCPESEKATRGLSDASTDDEVLARKAVSKDEYDDAEQDSDEAASQSGLKTGRVAESNKISDTSNSNSNSNSRKNRSNTNKRNNNNINDERDGHELGRHQKGEIEDEASIIRRSPVF